MSRSTRSPLPAIAALGLSLLAGATAFAPSTAAAGGLPPDRPIRCQNTVCLVAVSSLADTDGDGVSDVDERAAGTDPTNPASRPPVLDLLKLAGLGKLPSFSKHLTEVVVLPTVAPDGRSIVNPLVLPVRTSALGRLGISSKLLSQMGVDANLGVRVSVGSFGVGARPIGASSSVFVGGITASLVSAGSDDLTPIGPLSSSLMHLSANHGRSLDSSDTLSQGAGGVFTFGRYYADGGQDQQQKYPNGTIKQQSYSGEMRTTGTATQTPAKTTTNANGSTTTGSNTTATNEELNTVTTSGTTTTTNTNGTSVTQTATTTVQKNTKGEVISSTTVVTVEEKDKDGKTVKSTTTAQQCSAAGCSTPVTTTEYTNPDADTSVVWLSAADIERIISVSKGSNTTPGPVQPGFDPSETWTPTDNWVLVALVDDQTGDTTLYTEPRPKVAMPEADPRTGTLLDTIMTSGCRGCPPKG